MYKNKDENVHRIALSAIRGELQEREREKKGEREIKLGRFRQKQHEKSVTKGSDFQKFAK